MRRKFFASVFILISLMGNTQNMDTSKRKKIDVLEQKLPDLSEEKKAECVLELSELYWQINPEKSTVFAKQAVQMFLKTAPKKVPDALINEAIGFYYQGQKDSTIFYVKQILDKYHRFLTDHHYGVTYNLLCVSYRSKGEFQTALNTAEKALFYFKKEGDSSRMAGTLDNMSMIYENMGDYQKSLTYSIKSLKIFEKNKDSLDIAMTHSNMANLYAYLKDFAQAKQHLDEASVIWKQKKNLYNLADLYNNYGTIFMETKAYDSAFVMLHKALQLYRRINSKSGEATALQNIGMTYVLKENYTPGINKLKQAATLFEGLSDVQNKIDIYADIGEAYTKNGDFKVAEYYLNKALALADKVQHNRQRLKVYTLLDKLYAKEGSFKAAYKYAQKCSVLKDSIENKEVKKQIANLESRYQNEKKQKEIESLEHKQKLQGIKNQNLILIISLLGGAFLLFTYFVFQKRKKEKKIASLELQQTQLKRQQLEQELMYKNKQMATHAINIMQRNKLLQNYLHILKEIRPEANASMLKQYNSLKKEINKTIQSKKDWDSFKTYFEQTNESFVNQLMQNTTLTNHDFRLAALIKIGMTNKEIATIFNISPQSVKNSLYRLKKKIQLPREENIRDYLKQL